MVAATSWNIFSGYSGYLALGHAVFFGSGGYAVALAAQDWHVAGGWAVFALLPVAGVVAGLIAIPVGLIALRTRRHTFVVVTIAIFFIFQLAAYNFSFTGGTSGLTLAVRAVPGRDLQQPVLLRRADHPGRDRDRLVGGPAVALRPAAAGDPRRRGPRARPRRQDPAREADRVRDLGDPGRDGRRPLLLLPRPDLSAVRLRPAVRPLDRADGLLRRAGHDHRPAARGAGARVAAAVPDADVLEQRDLSDRLRRPVPGRDPAATARDHPRDHGADPKAPRAAGRAASRRSARRPCAGASRGPRDGRT